MKEVGRKVLEKCVDIFKGKGLGKIPGIQKTFLRLYSTFSGGTVEIDSQKFCITKYSGDRAILYSLIGHEPHVTNIFCSLIREGMTVVDAGAAFGYYTLLAAKRVGQDGKVYAFEPIPTVFNDLVENVKINGWKNVYLYNMALSDSIGERIIATDGSSYFGLRPVRGVNKVCIKTTRLDYIVDDADLVKIDVEGHEIEVLRGMANILEKGNVKNHL